MLDPSDIEAYHANLSVQEERIMQERLELFQAFSQLYDHRRDLLDEILTLPETGNLVRQSQIETFYIQGIVTSHQVYLISNLIDNQSRCFASPKCQWTLGRDPRQSTLVIKDKRLSRCHAAIQYKSDQGFVLTDLESTNGTYVNGHQINRLCGLRDGDQIRLGSFCFTFYTCHPILERPDTTIERLPADEDALDGNSNLFDTLRVLRPDFLI